MGIKEKLPLINSSHKVTRMSGYVLYGFLALLVLSAILPHTSEKTTMFTPEKTTVQTKTAYTIDGTNFVSKERMEENIKTGFRKRGDYKEVQVPLDTPVAETTQTTNTAVGVQKTDSSAEKKTAMSVTLEGYNFTAFLPSGWVIGGDQPFTSRDLPNSHWKGSVWNKAFYSGDRDSIAIMVETIPEDLRSSSQQTIIENLAGFTIGAPLKKTTFDGKEALSDDDIAGGNLINVDMFMPNNALVVVSAIDQTNQKAKDLLEKFEVRKDKSINIIPPAISQSESNTRPVSGDKKESFGSGTTKTAYTTDGTSYEVNNEWKNLLKRIWLNVMISKKYKYH